MQVLKKRGWSRAGHSGMGTEIGSFRFHFYSDEGRGPAHIHVRMPDGECKFWLDPDIGLARNKGVPPHDLRHIEKLVFEHHVSLRKAFYEYHHR
jgi:hypothetical protein